MFGLAPTQDGTRPHSGRALALGLAAGACLIAPLATFLNHISYPFLRIEIWICLAILVGIGLAVGWLLARLRPREQWLLSALLLGVLVPMIFDGGPFMVLVTIATALAFGTSSITFAGIAFSIILLFQLAQGLAFASTSVPTVARSQGGRLPVLVHVIVDEAIGIEGMPKDLSATAGASAWAKERLLDAGFVVYGRAYAEHMHTVNSVPQILGLGTEGDLERQGPKYSLGANRYMAALKGRGYAITVYQNDTTDYCRNPDVGACWTARPYRVLADSDLSVHDKARVLLRAFASLSDVLDLSAQLYDAFVAASRRWAGWLPPLNWDEGRFPVALGGMDALEHLIRHVGDARAGEAYFAHVLLPHYPYAFDASCRIKPQDEWTGRQTAFRSRAERYGAYAEQWRCAVRQIERLVQTLEAARPDKDFIVIVHGDHGSRVTDVDPNEGNAHSLSPQHFRDAYAALAAVRVPETPARYVADAIPVHKLIELLVQNGFRSAPVPAGPQSPEVVLEKALDILPGRRHAVPGLFEIH